MEKKSPTPMTPFDEWTVPNELHTLKLLLPYIPAASQQALGILIKVIELQHTLQYFGQQKNFLHEQEFSSGFSSPMKMLEEISPYLPPEQANMLETFRNMMNIMDMVQMMQAFSDDTGNTSADSRNSEKEEPFQKSAESENEDSFSDSDNSEKKNSFVNSHGTGGGFDPMQLVMGMLSPDQKDMFEMYQTMFSQPEEPAAPEKPAPAETSSDDVSASKNIESEDHFSQTSDETLYDKSLKYNETAFEESQINDIERIETNYE